MAVLAKSRALHGVSFGGTGTNLIIRGRQIFRDLAGFKLEKNGLTCSNVWLCCSSSDMIGRDGMEEKIKGERGRGGLLSGEWKRGGRAKLENLIPIDDIQARGPWDPVAHFRLPSTSHVTALQVQCPHWQRIRHPSNRP